jgi:hypothetical protein
LNEKSENIRVQIKYKDVEQQFSAQPQEAWLLVSHFFKEFIPSFEIAQNLWLSIDVEKLAKDLDGLVAFSIDGVSLLVSKTKLTDNETLLIWLATYYLGSKLGLIDSDVLSKDELQSKLGKSGKITSTRLGELVKSEFVAKTADDRYRITTSGICQLQKDVIPKVRAKANT